MKDIFKSKNLLSITLAGWGIIMLVTGLILNGQDRTILKNDYDLEISSSRVTNLKTEEIILKNMELEINNPLSVDVKDYIENIDALDQSTIKALKLDTSMVNINEAGVYTYTVSFKGKKYNGTFTIKEKVLPNFALTLKEINLEVGDAISTNVSSYVKENLTEEIKNNLVLDLSNVTTANPGTYQYKITYNNKTYTGRIIVSEKQKGVTVIKPSDDPIETQ